MFLHRVQTSYENLVEWVKGPAQRKAMDEHTIVNQNQKKHRNLTPLQKGFKRLTIVISIMTGLGFSIFLIIDGSVYDFDEMCLSFVIPFMSVWILYFFIKYIVVGYIVKGFKSKK